MTASQSSHERRETRGQRAASTKSKCIINDEISLRKFITNTCSFVIWEVGLFIGHRPQVWLVSSSRGRREREREQQMFESPKRREDVVTLVEVRGTERGDKGFPPFERQHSPVCFLVLAKPLFFFRSSSSQRVRTALWLREKDKREKEGKRSNSFTEHGLWLLTLLLLEKSECDRVDKQEAEVGGDERLRTTAFCTSALWKVRGETHSSLPLLPPTSTRFHYAPSPPPIKFLLPPRLLRSRDRNCPCFRVH